MAPSSACSATPSRAKVVLGSNRSKTGPSSVSGWTTLGDGSENPVNERGCFRPRSLSVPLFQHGEDPADGLGLAARRPARTSARIPGEDVEVDPGTVLRREALQEQGGGDRSGLGPFGGVVPDVGDVAVHRLAVAGPKRHAPDRIDLRASGFGEVGGQGLVVGIEG